MLQKLSLKNIIAFAITFWLVSFSHQLRGQTSHFSGSELTISIKNAAVELPLKGFNLREYSAAPKHQRLKVALLTIFLGHFGVHRIYLGTSPNVPVVYSLTLGGGLGILPLIDLVAILTTPTLDKYQDSSRVFMWNK